MRIAARTLALLAVLTLFCSLADARPIRGTVTLSFSLPGINVDGNFSTRGDSLSLPIIKAVKFPKSGIIINRLKQTDTNNLSGKRQVFRNYFAFTVDPENENSLSATSSRAIYPKGSVREMNLVTLQILSVNNPRKPPLAP